MGYQIRIEWDAEAEAIYIYLHGPIGKGKVKNTVEVPGHDSMVLDYDKDDKLIGIGILNVKSEPIVERI